MVFCYKIITDTPRRSGNVSPSRSSPVRKLPNVPSSLSQLITTLNYDDESVLDSIPEREWRLLAALARKREEDDEREKLADQFRKLWQKEKEERAMVEAETTHQYQRYLSKKRQQERSWHEYRQLQRHNDQQIRRGQLIDGIRYKERRSRDLLAWIDDKKTSNILDRAIVEETRAALAADRRSRYEAAEDIKKQLEVMDTQRRAKDARSRKNALLRDAKQRLAISNALSSWETSLLRQEVLAMDAAKRAHHAMHAALTTERSEMIARERDRRLRRARKMAAITAQMREDLRAGVLGKQ